MPFLDRFWWLQRLYALLFAALAAAGVLWYVRYLLPLEQRLNQFVVADAAFLALLVGVYLLLALNHLKHSQAALRRMERRRQAIESQEEAVPLARISPEMDHVDASPEPNLYFTWPATWFNRVSAVFEIAVAIGISVFWGYLAWQALAALLYVTTSAASGYRLHLTHPVLTGVTWLLILCAAFVPFGAFGDTSLLGLVKPLDMYVDNRGITCRNMLGVSRTVLWGEARLFEVSARAEGWGQNGPLRYSRFYALHTRRTSIYWEERTHAIDSPSLRYLQLAEFIHVRTGLRPRTLDPDLLAPDEPPVASVRRDVMLDFQLLFVGGGTASLIAGLSDTTSAGQVQIGIGLMLLGVAAVNWLSARRRRRAGRQQLHSGQANSSQVEAPPLAAGVRYGLTTGSRWTFNYNRAIFAVIAAALPAFTLVLVVAEVLAQVIRAPRLHLYPMPLSVLLAVLPAAFLSMIALILLLRAQPTAIIADDQSLHRIGMFGQQLTIRWPEVTAIEVHDMFGKPAFYTVRTATVATSVMWMAQPLTHREPDSASGVQAITPNQLAAIAVARSAKQLTLR